MTGEVVIAWHGTRNAAGRADTARLTEAVARALPGARVRAAFVDAELQAPALDGVLAELAGAAGPVVVVPAFVAAGYHVRHDIPAAVAAAGEAAAGRGTGVGRPIVVTPHLGTTADGSPEPRLVDAVLAAAADAGMESGLVLASAGSTVPEVAAELERLRAAVAERSGAETCVRVLDGAEGVVNKRDTVVPLLLANGLFTERARRVGGRCAALLGEEPVARHIVAALTGRVRAALADRARAEPGGR